MFGKPGKPPNRIDCLIGAGTVIDGNIKFTGGLRIDGEVYGNVTAIGEQPSTLVISEHARIDGEVNVTHLVINGTVNGPICSSEFLELQSRARVNGDVEYSAIEISLGAIVQGRLIHHGSETANNANSDNQKAVELKLASGH
jgi:cytoskeletal protein CcmA (bactofilin family)